MKKELIHHERDLTTGKIITFRMEDVFEDFILRAMKDYDLSLPSRAQNSTNEEYLKICMDSRQEVCPEILSIAKSRLEKDKGLIFSSEMNDLLGHLCWKLLSTTGMDDLIEELKEITYVAVTEHGCYTDEYTSNLYVGKDLEVAKKIILEKKTRNHGYIEVWINNKNTQIINEPFIIKSDEEEVVKSIEMNLDIVETISFKVGEKVLLKNSTLNGGDKEVYILSIFKVHHDVDKELEGKILYKVRIGAYESLNVLEKDLKKIQ